MARHTDPNGRFILEIPESWEERDSGGWRPVAGYHSVHLYDHTGIGPYETLAGKLADEIRPNRGVLALEASRRSLMLGGCPAERIVWTEDKDGPVTTMDYAIDLGDTVVTLQIYAWDGTIEAGPELDAVAATFETLRDPMAAISEKARPAYAARIAAQTARLADPALRDVLDETIDEIAAGLGLRAAARRREIEALTEDECRLVHPRLGTLTFDPRAETWSAVLALAGAPAPCEILIETAPQPTFAAEREAVLTRLDAYADRILAVSARWSWDGLVRAAAEGVVATFNEHWRDEEEHPRPLTATDIAGRLTRLSGYAHTTESGPSLTLYFEVADDLFGGHQIDVVMAEDGAVILFGLAG